MEGGQYRETSSNAKNAVRGNPRGRGGDLYVNSIVASSHRNLGRFYGKRGRMTSFSAKFLPCWQSPRKTERRGSLSGTCSEFLHLGPVDVFMTIKTDRLPLAQCFCNSDRWDWGHRRSHVSLPTDRIIFTSSSIVSQANRRLPTRCPIHAAEESELKEKRRCEKKNTFLVAGFSPSTVTIIIP